MGAPVEVFVDGFVDECPALAGLACGEFVELVAEWFGRRPWRRGMRFGGSTAPTAPTDYRVHLGPVGPACAPFAASIPPRRGQSHGLTPAYSPGAVAGHGNRIKCSHVRRTDVPASTRSANEPSSAADGGRHGRWARACLCPWFG